MEEVEINIAVEIFGPLSAFRLDTRMEIEIEPNRIADFLKDCREINWDRLAQGYGQNAWIMVDDWQSWVSKTVSSTADGEKHLEEIAP